MAIDLQDKFYIRNKPQTLPPSRTPVEFNSVELCANLNIRLIKEDMEKNS